MSTRIRCAAACFAIITVYGNGHGSSGDDAWPAFEFLIGEWVGEGDGKPGQGTGGFTLEPELGGKVLVRKNRADYPAANGRPATTHEDLMVVYPCKGAKVASAMYWDNEGHVIRYAVTPSADGKELVFLSDAVPGEPRFRLTYKSLDRDSISLAFEVAPPGRPDAFKSYIDAKCRRKTAAK